MPIDPEELRYVIDLQARSYRLLKWVDSALKRGIIHFSFVHENMSTAEAALDWINRFFALLPVDARPPQSDDREAFSNLFASSMGTFRLIEDPQPHSEPIDKSGCQCELCRNLVAGNHFVTRRLHQADHRKARKLVLQFVKNIAAESGIPLDDASAGMVSSNRNIDDLLAVATYARRLMERVRTGEADPSDLVLWRKFAWTQSGSPKPEFMLDVQTIVDAESVVLEHIRQLSIMTKANSSG